MLLLDKTGFSIIAKPPIPPPIIRPKAVIETLILQAPAHSGYFALGKFFGSTANVVQG